MKKANWKKILGKYYNSKGLFACIHKQTKMVMFCSSTIGLHRSIIDASFNLYRKNKIYRDHIDKYGKSFDVILLKSEAPVDRRTYMRKYIRSASGNCYQFYEGMYKKNSRVYKNIFQEPVIYPN